MIFEELLEAGGRIPDDWKFFCFNGKPHFIEIVRDRFIKHQSNFYDLDLRLLPIKILYKNFQDAVTAPRNFGEMIEAAKKLSEGTDFVRVDLYNIDGRIIFGELTNYPNAGLDVFEPAAWDLEFGRCWE